MSLLFLLPSVLVADLSGCDSALRAKRRELEKKIADLEGEAEDLRDEARSLEDEARSLERKLKALRSDYEAPELVQVATWLLNRAAVPFSHFARLQLQYAIDHDYPRILTRVCLDYGIALPLSLLPPVPNKERVARVDPVFVVDLPLFQWRAAA